MTWRWSQSRTLGLNADPIMPPAEYEVILRYVVPVLILEERHLVSSAGIDRLLVELPGLGRIEPRGAA